MYVSIESFFVFVSLLVYLMLRCLSIDELVLLVTYYNKKNVNVHDHMHVYHFIGTSSHIV